MIWMLQVMWPYWPSYADGVQNHPATPLIVTDGAFPEPPPSFLGLQNGGAAWDNPLIYFFKLRIRTSLVKMVKNLPAMQGTWVWFLGQEDCPGEGIFLKNLKYMYLILIFIQLHCVLVAAPKTFHLLAVWGIFSWALQTQIQMWDLVP